VKFLLPLRFSTPLVLGVLGLVLVLLAFFDGLQRTEQQIDSEAHSQLLTFGTRVASSLERLYADNNTQGLAYVLLRSTSEPHLRVAAVIDAQGNTIASTDATRVGKPLADYSTPWSGTALQQSVSTGRAALRIEGDGAHLIATFPFTLPGNRTTLRSHRYAVLYLDSDLSEPKRLNWARHVERAWLMIAIVAVALVLVWIYFNSTITQRLARLSAAMHRVALGDLSDPPIAVSGRDELGRLGEGFAQMLRETRLRRQALAASETRYRSIIQSMNEGVVTLDAQGRIVTVNESIARIAGLSIAEFKERTAFDPRWTLFFEDGRSMPVEENPVARALRSGQPLRDVVLGIRRQDGALRWVTASCEPLLLDAAEGKSPEPGVLVIVADITERRVAEQQGQRDRERLAAIVDSAMDGVICTDGALRITLFNRAAEKMFGRTTADMLGQPLDCLLPERYRVMHNQSVAQFAQAARSKRDMGQPGRVVGVRANGEEFSLEASISRIVVGSEVVLTVTLRDISERLRAEEQRVQLEAELRQSQKMQSLGTLTGGIAHDFNNILTAITGNAKLAQLELDEARLALPHPAQRSLAEIEKAAQRATDLVRQVLAFGRRQESNRAPVSLGAVVTEALKFLRPMLPAMIEIRSYVPDDLPLVAADATQIHQIVTNLGSNAAHAIGERAGVIDVTLAAVAVDEAMARTSPDLMAGRYLRMTVADSGCGIEPVIVDRIFEPFFTTKEVGQGTGLGLSVVHGIIKNHHGAITVHSTLGKGTRFELYFPVSEQSLPQATADANRVAGDQAAAYEKDAGQGKTIIYIDDEEPLVFLITRILERRGYRVLGFTQPDLALQELARHPEVIDVLISDLAMPGLSGFDVVRRAHAIRKDLPVVLVSGYVRAKDKELAEQLGVERLILKPDTVDALAAALQEVLAKRTASELQS